MDNKYFQKAISDFTFDMASGGAIKHLADLGYTVDEIKENLSYPTPKEKVSKAVWDYYLSQKIIVEEAEFEGKTDFIEKITYVREQTDTGKSSFRRVVTKEELPKRNYVKCEFGIWKSKENYKKDGSYQKMLSKLDKKDAEYIEGLPWPAQVVYHVEDERMKRICEALDLEMHPD